MSETGMKWYVLRAVSGKEAKVKEYLEAAIKHDDVFCQCESGSPAYGKVCHAS